MMILVISKKIAIVVPKLLTAIRKPVTQILI